jgi:hypothetical protein
MDDFVVPISSLCSGLPAMLICCHRESSLSLFRRRFSGGYGDLVYRADGVENAYQLCCVDRPSVHLSHSDLLRLNGLEVVIERHGSGS